MLMFDFKQASKNVGPKPSAAKRMNKTKNSKANE